MAKPQRAFALIAAIMFFASSVGFSAYVIWQMNNKDESAAINESTESTNLDDLPPEVRQQLEAQQQANEQEKTMLKGTKLANYTPVGAVNELQVIDLQAGSGETVQAGATVTAHYTGALAKDGTIFESSKDSGQPATFPLGNVIKGWQQGVPGMKVGGTRRLIIPASLAYGEAGSPPTIGPNEPLVFDIELVSLGQ